MLPSPRRASNSARVEGDEGGKEIGAGPAERVVETAAVGGARGRKGVRKECFF
jgi:hypothetical protein